MREFYLFILAALFAININAQNVDVNLGAGSYVNLASAFAAINAGTHTGDIGIIIVNNTSEPAGGAILNASGTGAASYTSITIFATGLSKTISGAATAGLPLIDFNGADNVTINGFNKLTFENTTVSATTGTSTIRFVGGATGNTITNCSIKGAYAGSVVTNGGNIFFSTDAVTGNGNDNNTISFCNIGPSGSNLPTVAICGRGSTTTTALGNSGISINNNNIFDYFGPAVTSAGVATNGGCNTWTISNNRFYQTGIRTWITGALHTPILINNSSSTSGAQGFTITNNVIGYASITAIGTYTLTGSNGSFRGIQYNGIPGSTVSTISNNTIVAVSLTGVSSSGTFSGSPFTGIYITNGVVISNSNTIGSQSTTGSLTYSTNSTDASDVIGIFNLSPNDWTANSNTIGGITAANTSTGAANVFGIRVNTSSTVATNLANNLVGGTVANSLQSTAAAATAGTQVVGILISQSIATLTANTIRNLTAPGGTGTGTSSSVAGIVFSSSASNNTVSKNTIFNLSNTNTTTASVVTGIQFNGSTANLVERNLIYDFTVATNNTAAEVNGINISGGTTTFRNNIIRLGAGINSAIGTGNTGGVNGFNEPSGTNNFYHNSVYIGGTPTTGLGPSYAFNSSVITNNRVVRNNIFFNARSNSGATGKNYALRVGGTGTNPAGLTINNNVYFANGTGAIFGFFNSADVANLAGWKTAIGQDANSISSNPLFVSTTDLHLQASSPAINVAVNLGVTNDFDSKTRPGTNALFDIGADERDGVPQPTNDIQATAFINPTNGGLKGVGVSFSPQVSFTNNGSNNQTNVTVRYTILNASSTQVYNQTFVIPVLNSEASTTVTFPSATLSVTGTYSIIAKAELGGDVATTNDQIIGSLTIIPGLSGSYTVGSGGNYASLTNDLGIFDALSNSIGVSGNITINIISDLTNETGTFALNENAGGFSVLIRPSGGARTITGSNTSALIKLNDADRVTIDGSINGSVVTPCVVGGDSTLRQLTIQNTNAGSSACVLSISSVVNGATNNVIRNVKILGQSSTSTIVGISMGGAIPGSSGLDGDNNRIENCSVKRTIFGIYAGGASAANQNTGTVMTQNDLSGLSTDRIRRVGMFLVNDNGALVSYNSIGGIDSNEGADAIGIGIGTQQVDATAATGNGVNNALVTNNKINGIVQTNTYSAAGIAVAGNSGSANTISNNMITGVMSNGTSGDFPVGIFVAGATGSDTRIYHNSVSMTGNRGTDITQTPSYGIAITGTDPTVELKNNIFYNIQEGGVGVKTYAIGMVTSTFANLNSNNNDFFAGGTQPGHFRSGSLSTAAGTDYATRALWTTATAKDANSAQLLPPFINNLTDLHLSAKMVGITGTPLASITTDFDCQTRGTVPEVGADEFGIISIATGSWTVPATWNLNRVPISSDVVIIDTPHTVTLNSTGNAKNVLQKGKLTLSSVSALLRLGF